MADENFDIFKQISDNMSDEAYDDNDVSQVGPLVDTTSYPIPESDLANTVRRTGNAITDTAVTAFDAATLGTMRFLPAGVNMVEQHMKDPLNYGPEQGAAKEAAWNEGYDKLDEFFRERRERLPLGFQIGAEMFGAGGGVPGLIDKGIDFATRKFAPNVTDMLKRYGAQTGAALPAAAYDRYMRDDMSLNEALQQGAFDAILGGGAGLVLGEFVAPNVAKAWRAATGGNAYGEAMDMLTGKAISREGDGPTLGDMFQLTEELKMGDHQGKTLMQILGGEEQNPEMVTRFHDAMAKAHFTDVDARKLNLPGKERKRKERYDAAYKEINRSVEAASEAAKDDLDSVFLDVVLDVPTVDAKRQKAGRQLAMFQKEFEIDQNGNRIRLPGADEIEVRPFIDEARKEFENVIGVPLEKIRGDRKSAWSKFTDQFRQHRQEKYAKDVAMVPADARNMSEEELEALYPETATVADFYNARKTMADLLTPAGRINGDPLTSQQRHAVTNLIKIIDRRIDDAAGTTFGTAKGEFAAAMREIEAEKLGKLMYQQRRQNVDTAKMGQMAPQHYGKTLEEMWESMPAREQSAFRRGWTNGIVSRTQQRSPLAELHYFYGDLDSGNVLKESAGAEHMRMILGPEKAEALERVYTTHNKNILENAALQELFGAKSKGQLPAALRGVDLSTARYLDEGSNNMILSSLAILHNVVTKKDAKKIDAIMELMTATDGKLARIMHKGVRSLRPDIERSWAVTGAVGMPAPADEERPLDIDEGADILKYLEEIESESE